MVVRRRNFELLLNAVLFKVLRDFPRILVGYAVHEIFHFLLISIFFCLLNHVRVDLEEVDNLLSLAN